MSSRLEQLLSPDKLRQNWQGSGPSEIAPLQNTVNLPIQQQYRELLRLIAERFPDTSILSTNLAVLSEQLNLAFGVATVVPADPKQKEAIVGLLEELEELLSAMELPSWRGR